jgi:hypothetical protein
MPSREILHPVSRVYSNKSPYFFFMRRLLITLSLLSVWMISPDISALSYPTSTPTWEVTWGTYNTWFTNIFTSEANCNGNAQVVWGFTSTGVPICVTPVSSGLYLSGQTLGDTIRYDGASWVRNALLFNNGTNIGIANTTPSYLLDVGGTANFVGIRMPTGAQSGAVLTSDTAWLARWSLTPAISASGITWGTENYLIKWWPWGVGLFLSQFFDDGVGVGLGTTTPWAGHKLTVAWGDILVQGITVWRGSGSIVSNVAVWEGALYATAPWAAANTAVWHYALNDTVSWLGNTAIGYLSLYYNVPWSYNVGVGAQTLSFNQGTHNTAIGRNSIYTLQSGDQNTAVWAYSLAYMDTGNNSDNTALGYGAWPELGYSGGIADGNVLIGAYAGTGLLRGDNNIAIWYRSALPSPTTSNQMSLGNLIYATNMIWWGWGEVGIGTAAPWAKLDVDGQVRIRGWAPGDGKFLRSNALWLATWDYVTASSVTATGIIGGWDSYIPKFGSGGVGLYQSLFYETSGQVGLATTLPTATLDINGTLRIRGWSPAAWRVLISDGAWLASWWSPSASTVYATGVIGAAGSGGYVTKFMPSGSGITSSLLYESGSRIGLANTNPAYTLDVSGTGNFLWLRLPTGASNGRFLISDATGNASWTGFVTANALNIAGSVVGQTLYYDGTNWIPSTNIYNAGANVGIWTASPGAYKLNVNGNSYFSGDLTVVGRLITDTIVNRSVNNVSISGSLLPDASAPIIYRDIGSNSQRWNHLYLSGQVTIGGGSPGANKILTSDASGLATWQSTFSGNVLTTGIIWGSSGYLSVFGAGGNGLYNSLIFQSGAYIGISDTTPLYTLDVGGTGSFIWLRLPTGAGLGRVLTSDALGNAVWSSSVSGATATGIIWGTQHYVPKFWPGGNGLILSQIYDDGTNVSIGWTGATSRFEVYSWSNTLAHFRWGPNNVWLWLGALRYTTTGRENTAIGAEALGNLTTAVANSAFWYRSLRNVTWQNNVALWYESLTNNGGWSWNNALGFMAGYSTTTGTGNTAIGGQSLFNNTIWNGNIALGYQANYGTNGDSTNNSIAIGNTALYAVTGDNNVALWVWAWDSITSWSNNIALWHGADVPSATASNQLSIGNWIYGSGGNIGIGTGSNLTTKLIVDSGINNISGLRLPRIVATSPVFTGVAAPLGVDVSWNLVIAQQGAIPVYTALGAAPNAAINTTTNPPTIGANYDRYFNINARQSFTVTDVGWNPYNCPEFNVGSTNKGATGCTQTPWATYVMTAQNATTWNRYGYQILISDRTDAPFVVRGGMYSSVSSTLMNTAMTIPALWFKAITVPTNRSDWFYINPWVDQNNNAITGGGRIGIGTSNPLYDVDVRWIIVSNEQFLWSGGTTALTPSYSWVGDETTGFFHPAADVIGISTNGSEALRVFPNGNMSIGSTVNSTKLRVEWQIMITGGTPGAGKVLTSTDATGIATWETPSGWGPTILQATVNRDLPSIASQGCSAQTFTVTGAVTGDTAIVSPQSALTDRLFITYARVSAANTVEVKFCNESGAAINMGAMNFYFSVIQ